MLMAGVPTVSLHSSAYLENGFRKLPSGIPANYILLKSYTTKGFTRHYIRGTVALESRMARVPITIMGYRCERCDHEWIPKDFEREPAVCPKCKSPYWNRPRKATAMMTYEDFRAKIELELRKASPLTWTEIRTRAQLPQKFPNNKWVHRMEADIGLERKKDANAIIQWSLR
jgi:DNA-directed RNA polymerase subunit RPC12/RpoP